MQPRDLLTAKEAQVALMVCATSLTRGEYGDGWNLRFTWPAMVAQNGKAI
jgi:hypothetical protein